MSSRQEEDERIARAEADARKAAREITHCRTERARVLGEGEHRRDDARGGMLETVRQGARFLAGAVGRTLGFAGDTNAAETAGATQDKVGECKDTAAKKAREAKDAAAEKAREARDAAKQKTEEFAEAVREKTTTNEGTHWQGAEKPATVDAALSPEQQKLEEYKQSAADAARKAMEYMTVRKEEVMEQPDHPSKSSVDATEEVARQKLDATRQRSEQVAERERRWKGQ